MQKIFFSKANKKKKTSSNLLNIFLWFFSLSFSIWLFWIILNPKQKGILGQFIFENLNSFFGKSVYILPFFLLYGEIAILINQGKGIITFLLGSFFSLAFFSSILEFIRAKTGEIFFDGGWIGYFLDSLLKKIFGDIGSIIFSIAFFLLSLQIVFKISWTKLLSRLIETIKIDYKQWINARNDFKNKITALKRENKSYDVKPITLNETKQEKDTQIAIEAKEKPKIEIKDLKPKNQAEPEKKLEKNLKEEKIIPVKNQHAFFKNFKLPDINLLNEPERNNLIGPDSQEIQQAKEKLEETLRNFEISAYVSGVYPGPVITRYEVTPSPGVKISSIVSLSNDIALAMRAHGIRVIAPIPGKSAIGFEIPNLKRAKVGLREILESPEFNQARGPLYFAMGRYSEGSVAIANLETMPHLLVAGATGSGKSVFLQSLILSLIYRNTPDEVKFLFIDPKRLELTFYEGIPYLYDPKTTCDKVSVITDAKEAAKSLVALTRVMEKRYKKFEKAKVKNIVSYNRWAQQNNEPPEFYIVVVIDELADLMLQAKNIVEENIQRLSQMARAVGIHLVLATQRPSVDVITGVIKANLPSRIALQVSSKVDSRVIIDTVGAESLIGKGDMLYLGIEQQKPERIQGCYVSEEEIERVVNFIKAQGSPNYPPMVEEEVVSAGKGGSSEELIKALELILERRRVSQDLLKAHFGSSARATNLLSLLEVKGFIHKPEGSIRWEIFFDKIENYLSQYSKDKPN